MNFKLRSKKKRSQLEDFMLGNPNAQRIQLKKTFCSKMLKINLEDDFEQKVFLSGMRCALGFSNIKSSITRSAQI